MGEFNITPGQFKYLKMIQLYGLVEDTGRTWLDSVCYGLRHYRAHRAAVRELGDWLPWHDRPENRRDKSESV